MIDHALKQKVIDELVWQPSFNEAHICVTARGGVVTLTGHVGSYAEKCAAERAAGRVTGVKAIVEELEIRYFFGTDHCDDDIAKRAFDVISWDLSVPKNSRVNGQGGGREELDGLTIHHAVPMKMFSRAAVKVR